MRVQLLIAAGLAIASVSACSTMNSVGEDAYVVTSATPDAITLRFREGDLNKATARAEAHCKETNRLAQMVNVMPADGYSMGSFRCM
jgi:predicted small secreted protein